MPLPDHLSPLASSSGDTCGFDIMHRCDLGEGRQALDLHTSAGVTGVCSRGGRKTSRQPQALDFPTHRERERYGMCFVL